MDQPTERQLNEDVERIFNESAQREAEAYALFSERYDREFPMPEIANVRLMQAIGWQFIVIMIQATAAILLAALRTADMFYEAASSSNWLIRWGDALTAVVAIEFGIVVFAAIKAEVENRKTQIDDLKSALNVNVTKLQVGIGVGILVSIIAGLGVSFKGFGVDVTWFKLVLAVVMGVGASVVAAVSGDILGAMLARFGNARTLAELEYRRDLTDREAKKRAMWEAAPERQIARSQLVELKEWQSANRYRAERTPRQPKQPTPAPQPKPKTGTRSNEIRMKIYAHLDKVSFEEQRIPGPSELMRELGVAKSYAKTVIDDWKVMHPELAIPTSETEEVESET